MDSYASNGTGHWIPAYAGMTLLWKERETSIMNLYNPLRFVERTEKLIDLAAQGFGLL
jgi:hypothetical protein